MEKVLGIGGVFFKARDPQRLAAWYRDHLGLPVEPSQPDPQARIVWATFPADSDYLGSGGARFMVNYRVANLDRMLEQLRLADVTIEKTEDHEYGRFAWITDPEGNRVELWQPVG